MKKRIVSIVLATVLVLAGCGNVSEDLEVIQTDTPAPVETARPTETPKSTPEKTVAPSATPSPTATPEEIDEEDINDSTATRKPSSATPKPSATVGPAEETATSAPQTGNNDNSDHSDSNQDNSNQSSTKTPTPQTGNTGSTNQGSTTTPTPQTATPKPHTHTWKTTSTEATCTAGGVTKTECTECHEVQSQTTTPAQGHRWDTMGDKVKDPTCGVHGTTRYKCLRQGCSATEDRDNILPTGEHDWEDLGVNDSEIKTERCRNCGKVIESKDEPSEPEPSEPESQEP